MSKKNGSFLKKASGTQKVPASVEKKHGLGRGLDSLIPAAAVRPAVAKPLPVTKPADPATGFIEIPILEIVRSPYQPRRDFREDELRELSESLKNNGLVQPPTVRKNADGRYELIAGERRLRAAQQIGWKKIRVVMGPDPVEYVALNMSAAGKTLCFLWLWNGFGFDSESRA